MLLYNIVAVRAGEELTFSGTSKGSVALRKMWRKCRLNKRNIFFFHISSGAVNHQEARKEVDFPSASCRGCVYTLLRLLNGK